MRIFALEGQKNATLPRALDRFERQFSYPLGDAQRFQVSHGADYAKFFRTMGRAQCFIAEKEGEIVGSLAIVVRQIGLPDGTDQNVGYLGDLRIVPHARGARTLFRLAGAAANWIERGVNAYFGVVMDGTMATPDRYTGRANVPAFKSLAKVIVVRFPTAEIRGDICSAVTEVEAKIANRCFRELSTDRYSTPCANPAERSLLAPVWLIHEGATACGCLEDTRRAKRLILANGTEMISAHLSSFAYRDFRSGATLVRDALRRARQQGFPALFLAIAAGDSRRLLAELGDICPTLAPATIFGHGLLPNVDWNLNTAEI
jgi:hypothetical protein